MYDYITKELPSILSSASLPLDLSRSSIFGHSMGGHGALTLYLKGDVPYKSCSAFSPICHPTACPWGEKAFGGYLSGGLDEGKKHDATILIGDTKGKKLNILIDSGLADNFYEQKQLLPEDFEEAARKAGHGEEEVKIRLQEGYDHSCELRQKWARIGLGGRLTISVSPS
jgi:S-formylglutathione hydrolase